MVRYELLMLMVPEVTGDEARNVESQLQALLNTAKGALISFERWGKYYLAYPVKKNDYGIYFLARFELPDSDFKRSLDEIKVLTDVKFYDVIMRSMISVLDQKQSLEYERPISLEETPRREASFLRPSRDEEVAGDDEFEESVSDENSDEDKENE